MKVTFFDIAHRRWFWAQGAPDATPKPVGESDAAGRRRRKADNDAVESWLVALGAAPGCFWTEDEDTDIPPNCLIALQNASAAAPPTPASPTKHPAASPRAQ